MESRFLDSKYMKAIFCLFTFFLLINAQLKAVESPPCVVVIFGATGDLTARKLVPALYNLAKEGHLSENTVIVGFARRDLTNLDFRQHMGESIDNFSRTKPKDNLFWEHFSNKFFYHQSDFDQNAGYESLQKLLLEIDTEFGTQGNRIFYLASQPSYFPTIITQLHAHNLIYGANDSKWSRVIIEKPFGADTESATDLQEHISDCLNDDQVFRIDHYLGKEAVQNLMALRFENSVFESFWNRQYIDNIQITLSEDIGIGTRGNFWEETGALRDLVQNHLMQLLTIVAMEPPQEFRAENIHEEKLKLLKSIRPFPLNAIDAYVVRGQYGPGTINGKQVIGYRQEPLVSEKSNMETYVAAKMFIDNERWEGVPFYIRGGKRLPTQVTEIVITFKAQPGKTSNILYIRIQPNMGTYLRVMTKAPGILNDRLLPVNFGYTSDANFGLPIPEAYEKLVYDAIQGDDSLFVKATELIEAWKLLSPILKHWQAHSPRQNFPNYQSGSWGPNEADEMLQENGHQWILLDNKY